MDSKQLVDILRESSDLVSKLGDIRLSDNRKLSSVLDIDGIQFWDAIAVEVALYHLPRVLDPTKKNWLFAGSERAGKRAAAIQTLLGTAKLNGLDPHAWLKDTLEKLPAWPNSRIDELLPLKVALP